MNVCMLSSSIRGCTQGYSILQHDCHVITLFLGQFLSNKSSLLASSCSCLVTGGCPKYNTELYIFNEPTGSNFVPAHTDLLPAKYQFWWAQADFFSPSFVFQRITVTLLGKKRSLEGKLISVHGIFNCSLTAPLWIECKLLSKKKKKEEEGC